MAASKEDAAKAAAGMALFAQDDETPTLDTDGAQRFKDEWEGQIKAKDDQAAALTGKENKKQRSELSKEVSGMKNDKKYIDALKVLKGLVPPNGNFCQKVDKSAELEKKKAEEEAAAAAKKAAEEKAAEEAAKKKDKPKKEQESAGLSREEKNELESLKTQIIDRKKILKEQGMSGGQQNKDPEIAGWVVRMNELKEKENPGAAQAAVDEKKGKKKTKTLNSEEALALENKKREFEEYTERLRTEFKYTKKEIAADPDYKEKAAEIKKLEGK